MKTIEKTAIKYLLIGIGVGVLDYLAIIFPGFAIDFNIFSDPKIALQVTSFILNYSANIIVGLFILIDSIKYARNKLLIPALGFCLPVFGVCFLLIEKYLILKSNSHG